MAWEFLQRAKAEGLPAKYDESDETIRVWDAKTGTFGAYHRDGRAKTFFKPGGHGYFERQPGKLIKLKD
jgi:pyocin large subunit-like protein